MAKKTDDRASRPDDDNPEWTAEDFAKARPAAQVLPQFIGKKATQALVQRSRGRPGKDTQLEEAEARGRKMLEADPRASGARYDRATGRVVVDLVNGCTYAFPVHLVQDLNGASHEALADIEVDGLGFNLRWPALDADLYVPALVSGIFGTRSWMAREFARAAGQTTSPTQAAAARSNGAKGGGPRKAGRS